MLTILHNPRCSKSRQILEILKDSKKEFEIREYLKNPLNIGELEELQNKLWLEVIEFTRTNEVDFKQNNLTKDSSSKEILEVMVDFPKIMQRAIVFDENKAVLCRPPEELEEFFK